MASREAPERHVAFLRAVNVGGRNRVPMADLRDLLEGLGYGDVSTHLQSGNAVFETAGTTARQVAAEIEGALAGHLSVTAKVLVRSADELEWAIVANPLADIAEDPARLLVTFLSAAPPREALEGLAAADFEPDVFAFGEREVYVWCPEGLNATKLSNAFWEKRLGVAATGRNWRTVTRMLELARG
ncbi:MAG TPA: DUF1697 domain-containing protein [Solirubrobacteraceae bacterium]|nr:DUF1697 domain-containing protein [Solirubrobacteraceae bacterium]